MAYELKSLQNQRDIYRLLNVNKKSLNRIYNFSFEMAQFTA